MQVIQLIKGGGISYFVRLAPTLGYNEPFSAAIAITIHIASINAQPFYTERALFNTPIQANHFANNFGKVEAKKVLERFLAAK